MIKAFTDGASRGNPGLAACAFVVLENETLLCQKGFFLGEKTNNYAEYMGVIKLLEWAGRNGISNLEINSDSELVVKQVTSDYSVNDPTLRSLHRRVIQGLNRSNSTLHWIPREENEAADKLVNCRRRCNREAHRRSPGKREPR